MVLVGKGKTKINPVRDHYSERDQRSFDHDELTASVCLGAFRLPCGDGRGVETISNARKDTADDQVGQSVSSRLQNGTDDHNNGAKEDGPPPSEPVCNENTQDGANETAKVVASGHDTCAGTSIRKSVHGTC